MLGRISSFESMGALDGPGVRFVVFMQGCRLRCAYCHNPETWDLGGGSEYEAREVFEKIKRASPYFGKKGGVTVSGGEPLLQADFVCELFELCGQSGIRTALDTAGSVLSPGVERLLSRTGLVILDIKMTNEEDYQKYTKGSLSAVLDFLKTADRLGRDVWIRQVIVPGINDTEENVRKLKNLADSFPCVKKTELLPFRKLCIEKYRAAGIAFPLENTPEAPGETMERLGRLLGG